MDAKRRIVRVRVRKRIAKDGGAGIEGLPLQLMIMVLIAGMGTALIMGWMGGLEAPESIGSVNCDRCQILLEETMEGGRMGNDSIALTITVADRDGDPVSGASVVLSGCGILAADGGMAHAITDSKGQAAFEGLVASSYERGVGFVTVTVARSDLGTDDGLSIPVIIG